MSKPYNHRDKYFLKAKQEGYKARSVYKLEEIDKKYMLFRPGMSVLDLGAFPGSFAQYTRKAIGPSGTLFLVDLQTVEIEHPRTAVITGDIYKPDTLKEIRQNTLCPKAFDVVVSDVAPKTTGIKDIDHGNSMELCDQVLTIGEQLLKTGGALVLKAFMGGDFFYLQRRAKGMFTSVTQYKPHATRNSSTEVFMVCKGKKPKLPPRTSEFPTLVS
jgi:23S rRNA (uridine2552-2'-O)-methyltransferase